MHQNIIREKILFFLTILFTFFIFMISLSVGKVYISFEEIFNVFINSPDEVFQNLILNFRLPKAITSVLVGIALPVAGFLMQELFKNPLAEPSVLGVTSMSSLGVGVVIFLFSILGLDQFLNNPWLLILASLIGSIISLLLIIGVSFRIKSSASLIILGFMLTGISGALIGMMQYFAPSDQIKTFLMWGYGSLTGLSWEKVAVFGSSVLVGLGLAFSTLRGITGLLLGERYAMSLGINIKQLKIIILLATAILTASATAFTGPIGFIGLAIPHICRSILKTGDMKLLIRWIILIGILLTLIFSILTEIFPFGTLPINIITALFGSPIVISILLNNKYEIR